MSDREKLAAAYAYLLGRYGEDSSEEVKFCDAHKGEVALLCEVVLLVRSLGEGA